jgi:hypothetical protein
MINATTPSLAQRPAAVQSRITEVLLEIAECKGSFRGYEAQAAEDRIRPQDEHSSLSG